MRFRLTYLFFILFFNLVFFVYAQNFYDAPQKVLIIYNNHSSYNYDQNKNGVQDSYELALTYAVKRGIPLENILGVNSSKGNSVSYSGASGYQEFIDEIVNPLKSKLDSLGKNSIYYFAIMYGIPYTVTTNASNNTLRATDDSLVTPYYLNSTTFYSIYFGPTNPFLETSPGIGVDKGHFDNSYTYSGNPMYLPSRFEGEKVDNIKDLIGGALYGEKYIYNSPGYYRGVGYIDSQYGDYSDNFSLYPYTYATYAGGDQNMCYGYKFFANKTYPYKREVSSLEIGEGGGFFTDGNSSNIAYDAMFYGGWYNYNKYHYGFRWLPGSVATDLNSNSAAKLRDNGTTFTSKALVDGLTASAGVVAEPYMQGTPRPEIMMYYILNGYNLAESAWHSIGYLRWRDHVIGDPIYNPMKSKVALIDSSFDRDLIVFDYVRSNFNYSRNISVFLSELENPEMAVFKLEYGLNASFLNESIDFNFDYRYKRHFNLSDLNSNTTYYYRVIAKDALSNNKTSIVYNFTTYVNNSYSLFSSGINSSKLLVDRNESVFFNGNSSCLTCSYYLNLGNNDSWILAKNMTWNYIQSGVYEVFFLVEDNFSGVKDFARTLVYVMSKRNKLSVIAETYNGNTSNFSSLANLSSVNNLVLEKLEWGKIAFNDLVFVRGINFDDAIEFNDVNSSDRWFFLNRTHLDIMGANLMNVSLYNTSFFNPVIYENGSYCFSCVVFNNSDNLTKIGIQDYGNYSILEGNFSLIHLFNYTYSNKSSPYINDTVVFYANYLNFSSHLTGADCNISFYDGTWPMSEIGANYTYSRSFSEWGTHSWNISCSLGNNYYANSSGLIFIDGKTIEIDSCQVLSGENKTYILTDNILNSLGSTCIQISADNITFKGNGYSINASNSVFGLHVNSADNVKISNLTIINSSLVNFYLSSSNNVSIRNIIGYYSLYNFYGSSSENIIVENVQLFSGVDYGFYLTNSDKWFLNNLSSSENRLNGLYLDNSQGGVYTNISLFGNGFDGLYIYNSDLNNFSFLSSHNNLYSGLYLRNSDLNNFDNVNLSDNLRNGFYIYNSRYNDVFNSSIYDNVISDLFVNLTSINYCDNSFTSVFGSGGEMIAYYNYSVNLSNKSFSELIICNGSFSSLTNISIFGKSTLKNNFLSLIYTNNSMLSKINSSENYYGINFFESNDNKIVDSVFDNNLFFGVNLFASNNLNINNSYALDNVFWDLNFDTNDLFYSMNLINFTGSGNSEIAFYNDSVFIENKTFSQLILWNADDSKLTNVTIKSSSILNNNGLFLYDVDNSNFSLINSSNNYFGFYLFNSSNNIFNISFGNNNNKSGFYLFESGKNVIINSTFSNNSDMDLSLVYNFTSLLDVCNLSLVDVYGFENQLIGFYNFQVNVSNKTFSQLILCNASNSNFTNVSILKSEKLGKRNLVNINSFNVSFDFLNFQSKFGKLRFLKNISLLRQISIGKNMYFQKNYVFINSSDLPELNISAEVVMENVTFIQPRILKNGELCSISNCQLISFMNNTLIFNVSGFSIYEVEETPTCSDGIQNQDETGVDCGGSCSACNVGGGGGGGSGGGGGGSNDDDDDGDKFELDYIMNNTENLSCEEDYICYNWSSCENGFKTKECIVTSNCSSIVKKERISCSVEIFDNSTIGISPYLIYMEKNSNGLFFTNVDLKGSNFVYFNSSNELGDNFEFYGEVNGVYYLASYNFTDSFGRKVYLLNILDSNNSLEMGLNGNSSDILDEKFDLSDLTFFGKNLNYTYLSFGLVFVVLFILFLIFVVRKLHVSKDVGNNGLNYVYDDLELRNIYEYIGKYKEEYSIEELKEMLLKYNYKLEKIELVLKNMGLK